MSDNAAKPVLVIFGITGDLNRRKLIPALYFMLKDGLLSRDVKIIGTSRKEVEKTALIASFKQSIENNGAVCEDNILQIIFNNLELTKLNPENESDYQNLKDKLAGESNQVKIFYFSVPASSYKFYATNLAKLSIVDDLSRILLEKPFGYNSQSAKELIDIIYANFNEQKVYRIDHYLARDTAQNLLTFRKYNPIFTSLWNAEHINKVVVRATEKIDIEGRSSFYEQTGALRDFIQSHLMQLLSITLMEIPTEFNSNDIHASKLEFLKTIEQANPAQALRGQYIGYKDEVGNPNSYVETYAEIKLKSNLEKWQSTEFILSSGKAMSEKLTSVTLEFNSDDDSSINKLVFVIQPDEGIKLELNVKSPGIDSKISSTSMDFIYSKQFNINVVDAYEKVLLDAYNGDQSLFASADEVMETWRVLDPVINVWSQDGNGLIEYNKGAAEVV